MSLPPLTICEEFLLLALNDEAGEFYSLPRDTLDCATSGAILMDLLLARRLDNDLQSAFLLSNQPTGDAILDPVIALMSAEPLLTPHPIAHWLRKIMEQVEPLREKALQRLAERGIIQREDKKILWVFAERRYPVRDDKEIREVKLRILGVILGDDIPEPHDIMLTALADACGLFRHILSNHELAHAAPRIAQVAKLDLIGQAVAKTVTEIETAIAMASGFR